MTVHNGIRARACVHVCVRACVRGGRAGVHACVPVCLPACVSACLPVYLRLCVCRHVQSAEEMNMLPTASFFGEKIVCLPGAQDSGACAQSA